MRNWLRYVYYWLPPLVWMSIIFYMSSQHRITMTNSETEDFFAFKTLHVIEYAFLFFLLYRALTTLAFKKHQLTFIIAFLVASFYSMTDEFHQLFIPSRTGRVRDVFIDMGGMIIMYTIIRTIRVVRKLL